MVELLVAMVLLLVIFLALMNTALLSIDANTVNLLRDEAVKIAEMRMNELRNTPFGDSILTDTGGSFVTESAIARDFRNINLSYTPGRRITDHGSTNKQVEVQITWEWKDKTVANGNPYTHTISTIRR
jgi:hypothetical protein